MEPMSGPHLGRPSAADDLTAPSTPPPTSHIEIETKLEADPDFTIPDLGGLAGLPDGARRSEPLVLDLRAVYFDTKRLDLVRSKVTLRRREGGVDDGWHLKLPAGAGARREIAVGLDEAESDDRPPAPLAGLVAGLTRGRKLREVARFATTRTVARIVRSDGTALVEIADDAVTATRLLPGEPEDAQRWREIEVEVLEGTSEQMEAVVLALVAAGARTSGSASKLARALGVDATTSPDVASADHADRPSAGAVVLAALSTYRQQLLVADVALRWPEPEAEALHDARAAARRIRSILRVYESLFIAGSTDRVSSRLRRLGSLIGATRDLDVVTARILDALEGFSDQDELARQLEAHLGEERRRHLDRLGDRLGSSAHRKTIKALDALIEHPAISTLAASPADEVLPDLLTTAWFDLRAMAEAALADPGTPSKSHEVRKAAKTVRYAAETAARVLGADLAAFAEYAEQIQEILGQHQDAVTTAAHIADGDLGGEGSALPAVVAERLCDQENRETARTFDAFQTLWGRRPDRPGPAVERSS